MSWFIMNLGAGDKNAPMDERYFYAIRTKVKDGDDGMNTSRSAGIGYWKISGTKKVVDESGKQLIGHLASLKYIIRREKKDLTLLKSSLKLKGDEEKTNWVMQELTLSKAVNEVRMQFGIKLI